MSSHIMSAFDEELKYLNRRISEMGGLAEQMCADAVRALVNADGALAQKVISDDAILDNAEREIQEKAIVTIAKRQPMASDLREIHRHGCALPLIWSAWAIWARTTPSA